jgi:hypothetical protein
MKPAYYWLAILLSGALFGAGLTLSTMIHPEAIFAFLLFENFGLLLVLGSATGLALLAYQLGPKIFGTPWLAQAYKTRPSETTKRTLIGAALFGVGWGISGVCPGPAVAGLGAGNWPLLYALIGMLAGAYVQGRWFGKNKN